jgi:sugar lactone lactonase YvrE
MTDLGAGYPQDLSADGGTVVGSGVWSAATGWRSLAEALAEWGLDVSGLALESAIGISDDGLAIVGQGIDPQGRTRAWLALRGDRDCPAAPPPEPPPPAPLPAKQALLWVGDLPAPLTWLEPHGFAVAPDGVVYLGGTLHVEEGSEIRLTDGVLEIPPGGPIRTLTEDATTWHDPVGADRESVVWSEAGSRIVRVDRRDGAELLDLDLARLGPGSVDSVVLDPDGNAWATTEGVGSDGKSSCFGVVLVTRHGYPERLRGATGDPCFLPEPAVVEWHLGALHLWSLAALRRMEADGTLTTVVSAADGLASVGPHDFDAAGNLYVSEFLGDSVWKIDREGERTRIIDRDGDLVGHPLAQVHQVRADPRGHVFVSGAYEPSVFEIFPNGAIRRILDETGDGEVPADFGVHQLELDATGNLHALTEGALFGIPPSTDVPEPAEPDRDGDGLLDAVDDCPLYPNADQRDVDGDGYGSVCDPDFNNDGVVGAADLARLGQVFGSTLGDGRYDPVVDMDGNGVIGTYELAVLSATFGTPPGLLRP